MTRLTKTNNITKYHSRIFNEKEQIQEISWSRDEAPPVSLKKPLSLQSNHQREHRIYEGKMEERNSDQEKPVLDSNLDRPISKLNRYISQRPKRLPTLTRNMNTEMMPKDIEK